MKSSKGFKLFSWSLIFIVFICLVIALTNFAIIYKDCRDDVLKTSNAADTTAVAVEASVSLSGSMSGEKKCCNCSTSLLRDVKFKLSVLDEIHNIFDQNLLTFLVSFSLIAVLTMLIHDSTELKKGLKDLESNKNIVEQELHKWELMGSELDHRVSQCLCVVNSMRKSWDFTKVVSNNILNVSLFNYEFKLLASTIESSRFIINDTVSASISKLCIGVDDFNREIPAYSHQLKEEAVFAEDDIDSMLDPLYDVQQGMGDLIRSARDYESKLKKRNPDLVPDLEAQLSPVESSVDALIHKIEGYRAAPKNQQA